MVGTIVEDNIYIRSRECIGINILASYLVRCFKHCFTRPFFVSITRSRPNESINGSPVQFIEEINSLQRRTFCACAIEGREFVSRCCFRGICPVILIIITIQSIFISICTNDLHTIGSIIKCQRNRSVRCRNLFVSTSHILTTRQFDRITTLHEFYCYIVSIGRVNLNCATCDSQRVRCGSKIRTRNGCVSLVVCKDNEILSSPVTG